MSATAITQIDPRATLMFAEAGAAADAVVAQRGANAAALDRLASHLRAAPPSAVVTCARGSSDHAATFAKYLIETRLGILVSSASPSVSSVYAAPQRLAGALFLAISQSGRSPDLLASLAAADLAGARTLALVNVADSPLATMADDAFPLHAGIELSVAATKSYIASLAALVGLVAAWSEDDALNEALDAVPAMLRRAWDQDWSLLVNRLADARGLFVIGRGLGLGIAQEAALKFKETCGLHAEAYSAAEVRHGPMALIGPDFPLLVFRQSDETEDSIDGLIKESIARGADVFITGAASRPTAAGANGLPSEAAHPAVEPMLQIQSFYRAVNALSVRRGHDPDRPPHLRKVTETL